MKIKNVFYLTLSLFFSNSISAVFVDVAIEDLIKSSELIVKGKVEKKASRSEDVVMEVNTKKNGKISVHKTPARIPMTTYVIVVDEVLSGDYREEKVVVKMQGGCGDEGLCLEDSSNYNYQVKDDVIIFLNYDPDNKSYYSSDGGLTAFKLSKSNNIYREGDFTFIKQASPILLQETDATVMSLEDLRKSVQEAFENE